MADKVGALKENWGKIKNFKTFFFQDQTHPLFSVEPVTLSLDPHVLGNILSVVPALKIDNATSILFPSSTL